jgi:hypothetical protein
MPGRGTGVPLYFYCARCRKRPSWRDASPRPGYDVLRTGRTRKLRGYAATNRPPRALALQIEYRCLACGHTGWSRHCDVARKPLITAMPSDPCPAHHPNLPHENGRCLSHRYHRAPHTADNGQAFVLPGECSTCAVPMQPVESNGGSVIARQCPRCLGVEAVKGPNVR